MPSVRRSSARRLATAATAGLVLVALAAPNASAKGKPSSDTTPAAAAHAYAGEATALSATVAGLHTELVHAGPISSTGGIDEDSLLSGSLSVVSATVLHAVVVGEGDATSADASVADLAVAAGTVQVGAAVLVSEATVSCEAGVGTATADSSILDLSVQVGSLAIPVNVTGQPNQTIDLGVGTLVLNEQDVVQGGALASASVNALHLTVDSPIDGLVEVIVSSATASMTCDPGTPAAADNDWFTGGGTIFGTPSGERANFGIAGGIRNGSFWGHMNYVDHSGIHVKATSITSYEILDETTRRIEGAAKIGNKRLTYVATISDNGEPGTADTFELDLSNGYHASATLAGGNLQLHPTN